MRNSLFAFVGPKDPFVAGEIAEELSPGPVLSILSARSFTDLFLFHTPHTADSAKATVREVRHRYPACRVELYDLPVSDPKDYSAIMGVLGRRVRKIVSDSMDCNHSVCVSSGTAEMRAAWFLLYAAGVLPARLLQVGSPAEPLFGAAAVKDVSLNGGDWHILRDLVMPQDYFDAVSAPPPLERRAMPALARALPAVQPAAEPAVGYEPHVELESALKEISFHVYSSKMRLLVETVEQVAGCNEATLIQGETGTGKELVARLVHRLSPQRNKKMVNVNCAAIPADLAESQLFGHLRGAFTGATADREGLFEAANGGTLFLDEIGELSQACQAKMLRALQFGEFERLGSTKTIHVTVRVIAATNRKLAEEVAKGTFRGDLYHRLNILPLEIPPLRERAGEIVPLALALLKAINAQRQTPRQISKDGLRRLELHYWPGNVRELDATLRRSVAFASGMVLRPEDILIDQGVPMKDALGSLPEPGPDFKLDHFLDQCRTHLILRALEKAGGKQAGAAALLGISKQAVNQFLADKRR